MNIAMGLGPAAPARGGERGGRMEKGDAPAFDEALTHKPARRMPTPRDDAAPQAGQAEAQPPAWRLGGYGDKLALLMPFEPAPNPSAGDPAAIRLPDGGEELPDATAHETAAQEAVPDTAATPDVAPRTPPDTPATTIAAIPAPRDEGQPAGQDEAAATAGIGDAGGDAGGDAEGDAGDDADGVAPRAHRAAQPATGTPAGNERVQAAMPVPSGEPARTDRRTTQQAREAERRPAAPASTATAGVDKAAPREQHPIARTSTTAPAGADKAAPREQSPAPADRPQPEPLRMASARPTTERGVTEARAQAAADAGQPRVNVLGFSTSAPPALPATLSQPAALSPTAAGVAAAMEAEPAWRAAATEPVNQRVPHSGPVSALRIQLNPAELGMVTARLVATGSQLEIEIRVESNDARQRLSTDADAIVKALRGVGYDIERVTIQQVQPGAAAPQQQGGSQRDPFMQGQQGEAGTNAGRGGQNGKNDADTARGTPGETAAERAGGGVYI